MIYQDTYTYLLKHTTSKEFDVILHSVLNVDWDGIVQCSVDQLAKKADTTKKYLTSRFAKLTNIAKYKAFTMVETANGLRYRLNLGQPGYLKFDEKTANYCKKYNFFYEKSFSNLPLNAKRLLLMGAFRMSTNKAEKVRFDYNEIVPNTKREGHSRFNRQRLVEAIEAIQKSELRKIVSVSLASNLTTQVEEIFFTFEKGTLNQFQKNHTERKMLRSELYKAGYLEYLSDEVCIEIEKVASYIFKSLTEEVKNSSEEGVISGAIDEVLGLARYTYRRSLKKLAKKLNADKEIVAKPKEVSAYLSEIISEVLLEEAGNYNHQAESIRSLLGNPHFHQYGAKELSERNIDAYRLYTESISARLKKAVLIAETILNWYERWVLARTKSVVSDLVAVMNDKTGKKTKEILDKRGWKNFKEDALKHINNLKMKTYENLNKLGFQVERLGNKAVGVEGKGSFFEKNKERFVSYFSMFMDKIQSIAEPAEKAS